MSVRRHWLVIALLFACLPLMGTARVGKKQAQVSGGDASMLEYCAKGGKGRGYNTLESCYAASCGNYPWSSIVGGEPANGYNTPTTAGGNSWVMDCTGDGTATGTPDEDNICLADGEQIHMNIMADLMLAFDNTCTGGKVYLPAGLYHDGGCGQDADGNANNCPWLQKDYTHEQQAVQMYGGVKLIGAGAQWHDPVANGRDQSKTWLIQDRGRGGASGDTDPGGAGSIFGRWNNFSGMSYAARQCKTGQDDQSSPLACLNNTTVEGKVAFSRYGRFGTLLGSTTMNTTAGLCIDNTEATTGVCENDPRITCTTDAGDRPAGGTTGDCDVVGGDCLGYADMIAADLTAGKDVYVLVTVGSCGYGDTGGAECATTTRVSFGRISAITAGPCNATGKYAEFESAWANSNYNMWPIPAVTYDTADRQGYVTVIDTEDFYNETGGIQDVSFMQGHWAKRTGCTDGSEAVCNDSEIITMGAAYKGGFDRVSVWYTGTNSGYSYSAVDGMGGAAIQGHLRDSLISNVWGILTDAGGWIYERDTWRDNVCSSSGCLKIAYADGMFMRENTIMRNFVPGALISFNLARDTTILDTTFISNSATDGFIRNDFSGKLVVDGVYGYGNRGPMFILSPQDGFKLWNQTFRNVSVTAQYLWPHGSAARFFSVFQFTDYDGSAGYDTGQLEQVFIDNVSVDTGGATDACLFAFGGGVGDESDAANGLGRVIQYQRGQVTIQNANLNGWGSGTNCAFCLGNTDASENECDERIADIWASDSGRPSWKNVSVDGVKMPDNPIAVVAADNTNNGPMDCDVLAKHTVVWIYDDPTAVGTCDDTDANGALEGGAAAGARFTSCCVCDGAGTWSECAP